MPSRLLLPARSFHEHVRHHPGRLLTTCIVLLVASTALLLYAVHDRWEIARQGRIDNCIAVNELSRKIYVTLADFGVPRHERAKYRPTEDCEEIP